MGPAPTEQDRAAAAELRAAAQMHTRDWLVAAAVACEALPPATAG